MDEDHHNNVHVKDKHAQICTWGGDYKSLPSTYEEFPVPKIKTDGWTDDYIKNDRFGGMKALKCV